MGVRFRKSFKIAPGVRVNVGSKSAGVSFGGKGLRYSVNSTGRRTATAGIPGSGLSYSVTNGGKRKYKNTSYQTQSQLSKMQKEAQKLEALERANLEVKLYENQIELIHSIHKECDDYIDWQNINSSPPPFMHYDKGPNEKEAHLLLDQFKPSFFQKLFKKEENEQEKLRRKIEEARLQDQQEYKAWEELSNLSKKILEGDTDAYLQVIEEMSPLDDLSEFGSGFTFFVEEPTSIEVEFDVHSENTVPSQVKSLTKTGKLSVKEMPKTKYYDIYQDYVCSCILRIARDMFALLPIETINIHAMDQMIDTSTGHTSRSPIVSVKIGREGLNRLNFDAIDCSDSMQNFEHNMKFKKTKGFEAVQKISL